MEQSFFFGAKSSFTGECTITYWTSASNKNEYPNKHRGPSIAKIIAAIKSLPSNKAAVIDGIQAEFYKANPNQAACLLQPLIHEAWANETLPNEWKDCNRQNP